jgi:hypothetical protein
MERNVHILAADRGPDMAQTARYCLLVLSLLGAPGRSHDVTQVLHEQGTRKSDDFLFEVRPRVVGPGETAILHWSIKGAEKVLIEETSGSGHELRAIGTFGGSGSLQVHPKEDTIYVVTCEGSTTFSCASVTVRVRVRRH